MSSKPKPKRPNAVRRIMEREESRERRFREASVASNGGTSNTTPAPTAAPPKPNRPKCANPKCPKPNVVDGTCQTCGMVADDSNIVSEITFGESSSGAAVVHGTHVAFDQGGIRGVGGLAFRRVAGGGASEARERSLREVKSFMQQYTYQLRLGQSIGDIAFRYYKACSHANFVQGRRKQNVAAICLYAACRAENNHKIMLLDLADLLKVDVFILGRGYKDFLNRFPEFLNGPRPIVIEDLIYRFASKLELYHDTDKVALSAVRIAKRMQHDNITHGRRPAGICGAAVIMAARAHNYRRTVREVVYIAKVTMATIQERMDEFASVPAAQMTVKDFHDNDPLEAGPSHDPPFVYKQTDEWKAKHTRPKKRKRKEAGDGKKGTKKIRTKDGSSAAPQTIDKDGFVVPPVPQQGDSDDNVAAEALIVTAVAGEEQQLRTLVEEYGELDEEDEDEEDSDSDSDSDSDGEEDEVDPSSEEAFAKAQGVDITTSGASTSNDETAGKEGDKRKKKGRKHKKITMPLTQEWQTDEALLEKEMEAHLHDPEFLNAAQAEKVAEDNRVLKMKKLEAARKRKVEQSRQAKQQAANASSASSATAPAPASTSASDPTTNSTPADSTPANSTPANSTPANSTPANSTPSPTSTEQSNTTKETDTVMEDAGAQERQQEPITDRLNPSFPIPYTRPQYIGNPALDDPIVHEDEFADDPEVKYCRLGDAEAKMKEQIWVNLHVDFLRVKQQRVFDQKLAGKNKGMGSNRRKNKKNRIEDNGGVPETAEEAAVNMLRNRGISTKLDYSKLGQIFDLDFNEKGPGSNEADSALASEAGYATEDRGNEGESSGGAAAAPAGAAAEKEQEETVEEEVEDAPAEEDYEENYNDDEGRYDDYNEGGEEDINPFADDDEMDDEEEY